MTTTPRTPRLLRAAIVGALALTTACGTLPTAPATPSSAVAAPADGPSRASGYMLSSGRDER